MAELCSLGSLFLGFAAGKFSSPYCKTTIRQRIFYNVIYTNRSQEHILQRKSEVSL